METSPDTELRARILATMLADIPWATLVDTLGTAGAEQAVREAEDELAALRQRKQEAA